LKLIAEQGGNNKSKMNFIQRQLLGTGKKKSGLRPENMSEAQIKAEIANISR